MIRRWFSLAMLVGLGAAGVLPACSLSRRPGKTTEDLPSAQSLDQRGGQPQVVASHNAATTNRAAGKPSSRRTSTTDSTEQLVEPESGDTGILAAAMADQLTAGLAPRGQNGIGPGREGEESPEAISESSPLAALVERITDEGGERAAAAAGEEGTVTAASPGFVVTDDPDEELAKTLIERLSLPAARERLEALAEIREQRMTRAGAAVAKLLGDYDVTVRRAAIETLVALSAKDQAAALVRCAPSQGVRVRADAVAALVSLGDWAAAIRFADDEAWQVRQAAAAALATGGTSENARIARRLSRDVSVAVREATLEATRHWPVSAAGDVWLAALQNTDVASRTKAAELLAARWRPAAAFDPAADATARYEAIHKLTALFAEFKRRRPASPAPVVAGAVAVSPEGGPAAGLAQPASFVSQRLSDDPAISQRRPDSAASSETNEAALVAQIELLPRVTGSPWGEELALRLITRGDQTLAAVESMLRGGRPVPDVFWKDVAPALDPVYRTLADLPSREDLLASGENEASATTIRRRCLANFADRTRRRPLSRPAVYRLAELLAHENDAICLAHALRAVAAADAEPAQRLAYAAVTSPDPPAQLAGCEYLARHGSPQHAEMLRPLLESHVTQVQIAALNALGRGASLPDAVTANAVQSLVRSEDRDVKVAAAACLAGVGDSRGVAAVLRLAHDDDHLTRKAAAATMAEQPQPQYVATLIGLLQDERNPVRLAALAALPRVAGHDVAEDGDPGLTAEMRIERWRRWHAKDGDRISAEPSQPRSGETQGRKIAPVTVDATATSGED